MTDTFQYTVLKYRHSFITGEVLNLGILFFLEDGRVEFRYPSKLSRISSLYSRFPISFIKNTLASFKSTARKLSKEPNQNLLYASNFESLLGDYFLNVHSGSLYFGEVKQGVAISDCETVINHYYNLYLGDYQEETHLVKNEKYIIDKVKNIIKEKYDPAIESKFKVNKVLHDPHGNFNESFEYGWQNETLHLLTPIGFDLEKEQSLEAKALKWFGILNFLKEPANQENISFDILLTEPANPKLKKIFQKATDIIERSNAPVTFVEEGQFNQYIKHAVEVVLDHESDGQSN